MCFQGFAHYTCGHHRLVEQACASAGENPLYIKASCRHYQRQTSHPDRPCGLGRYYCRQTNQGNLLDVAHSDLEDAKSQEHNFRSYLEHRLKDRIDAYHKLLDSHWVPKGEVRLLEPELQRLEAQRVRIGQILVVTVKSKEIAIATVQRVSQQIVQTGGKQGLSSILPGISSSKGGAGQASIASHELLEGKLPDKVGWQIALQEFGQQLHRSMTNGMYRMQQVPVSVSDYGPMVQGSRPIQPYERLRSQMLYQWLISIKAGQGIGSNEIGQNLAMRYQEELKQRLTGDVHGMASVPPRRDVSGQLPLPNITEQPQELQGTNRRANFQTAKEAQALSTKHTIATPVPIVSPEQTNLRRSTRTRKSVVRYAESPGSSQGRVSSRSVSPTKSDVDFKSPGKSEMSDEDDDSPPRIGQKRDRRGRVSKPTVSEVLDLVDTSQAGSSSAVRHSMKARHAGSSIDLDVRNPRAAASLSTPTDQCNEGTTSGLKFAMQSIAGQLPQASSSLPATGAGTTIHDYGRHEVSAASDQQHMSASIPSGQLPWNLPGFVPDENGQNIFTRYAQMSTPFTPDLSLPQLVDQKESAAALAMPPPKIIPSAHNRTTAQYQHGTVDPTQVQTSNAAAYPWATQQSTKAWNLAQARTPQSTPPTSSTPVPSDPFRLLNSAPDYAQLRRGFGETPELTPAESCTEPKSDGSEPAKGMSLDGAFAMSEGWNSSDACG